MSFLDIDLSDSVLVKKVEIYETQISRVLERLSKVLETKDQDYINTFIVKVLNTSFHRGFLVQKDIVIVAKILNKKIKYDRNPKKPIQEKNRDWIYALDYLINFKIDVCAICDAKLHAQGKFPRGYPDKWKLCCNHREALQAGFSLKKIEARDFEKHKEKFEELFTLQ